MAALCLHLPSLSCPLGSHESQEKPPTNDPNDVREVWLQVHLHCHSGRVSSVRPGLYRK